MEVIYEGTLLCQKSKTYEMFQVKPLERRQLSQILEVQDIVFEHLEEKNSLQPLTMEEFEHIFNDGGLIIGAFVGQQLIGFRALLFPGDDPENLGRDLGLTNDEQQKVVHQELSCVLPDYRGNRLQRQLAHHIMKQLTQMDLKFRYLCCTVYPTNFPSLKDKFQQQMLIANIKEKYSGKMRYIFFKDLEQKQTLDEQTITALPIHDYEQQKSVLASGYYGFNIKEENGQLSILFAKKV